MGLELITHKGVEIVYIDFRACRSQADMLAVMEESARYYANSAGNLITLDDFTGMTAGSDFIKRAKELGPVFRDKRLRGAVIGIDGMKKLMLNTYNLFTQDKIIPFDRKEDALEFLIKD